MIKVFAQTKTGRYWCYLCNRTFRWRFRLAWHVCDLGRLGPKEKAKWLE